MIVLATSLVDFRILATTVDKSVGSVIDRVVTLLQIKWTDLGPGAGLEKYCAEQVPDEPGSAYDPPTPMRGQLAFSFSGLHSWVERTITAEGGAQNVNKRALARAFQTAAFAHLETKLLLALKWCTENGHVIHHVVVSGGVASNMFLRERYGAFPATRDVLLISVQTENLLAGVRPDGTRLPRTRPMHR